MKTLIWLKRIQVENANCIHGLTWGFPAVTNFLGFTHALSRQLSKDYDFSVDGCAVISHESQVQAHSPKGFEYIFSQTRNPLTKDGSTAPINQEGRMHMTISLLLSSEQLTSQLQLSDSIEEDEAELKQAVLNFVQRNRIAGGSVPNVQSDQVEIIPLGTGEQRTEAERRVRIGLLPGFALIDRSELLQERLVELQGDKPEVDLLDAWLSFSELRYQYTAEKENTKQGSDETETTEPGQWKLVPKQGYLVPISRGFKAIGPLYAADEVISSRDSETPFRLVESAYGVGQWLSPHRCQSIEQLLWHYQQQGDWYLAQNNFQSNAVTELNESTHV